MTTILGTDFFEGSLDRLLLEAAQGGLFVFPSGPGMACDLLREPAYRSALAEADFVVPDSSLMVMAHNLVSGPKLRRLSGLLFLRAVIEGQALRELGSAFWVMPSKADRDHHLRWLNEHGIPTEPADTYLAPRYGARALEDATLLDLLRERRPQWIILAIGGGVQERLGHYLRQNLADRPAILCIGAAIGFVTGVQANIPPWADRLYLGWLLRCLKSPGTFIPRYWNSRHLPWLIWKYRDRMPPLQSTG